MEISDIRNVESEAGIIASIILHPELVFYSEQLKPNYFTESTNAYIYYAVEQLARRGVEKIDAYNITNILKAKQSTEDMADVITIPLLMDVIENARFIARSTPEDYRILVDNVMNAAFRRYTCKKLKECERLCFENDHDDIEQKIYATLDNVMVQFSTTNEIPQYKDVVDSLWGEIVERQQNGSSGIPFKFPTLNQYAMIEPGELIIFGAEAKRGKSIMLLNCLVDLLKRDIPVLYIDSELNTRMFTCRLIAHLTRIEFYRVKSGKYTEEEGKRIQQAIAWLKTRRFTHRYLPMFDSQTIYTTVQKVRHTQGLEVLIVDYFKGNGDGDAFATYQEMGKLTDLVKNKICGDLNIAGIGAAQATSTGRLADSAKISRNASTIIMLQDKSIEEVEADGPDCGNKKITVVLNRNGAQMGPGEYIDLYFNGNLILYEEAKQHIATSPY